MKQFISIHDVDDPESLVKQVLAVKETPFANKILGENKTIGLIFFNPSLRTRMSTQRAAQNLGMNVMVMNVDKDGWALEYEDGAVMNGTKAEHIKDAAAVMSQYCEIIGLRSFPELKSREADYSEKVFNSFVANCSVPVISLESATLHPLQSLADLVTIREFATKPKPKVVLAWAPHIRALPQAVPNSFAQWMSNADVDFTIAHPEGLELDEKYTGSATITHNLDEALKDADFIYVKNWSSYKEYGKISEGNEDWLLDEKRLANAGQGYIMHCLPVRRNVELSDELLDSNRSLVIKQAQNRLYAAQTVIQNILTQLSDS
ncbi:MAG: acetylornithine carbamoyltransferase [Bacteroidota bacterium]